MNNSMPYIEALNPSNENIERFREIYFMSFPEEERRPWEQMNSFLLGGNEQFRAFAIMDHEILIGFITVWTLQGMNYIEHFAVSHDRRGNGTGHHALRSLMETIPGNYVLEVEPKETGEIACRRIRFYSKLGFTPREEFFYLQPPYADGLPEVPLTLMTAGDVDPENAAKQLWYVVYHKKAVN
ncbi:MAG: GNAT family N-acetyltransferase [Lachnospiraceae bacterium]|nr:GNAT family N-acetyltransferase [Lachnospiraceae bacterium]